MKPKDPFFFTRIEQSKNFFFGNSNEGRERGLFGADSVVERAAWAALKPNIKTINNNKEKKNFFYLLFVKKTEFEVEKNLSGDLDQLNQSNVLAKAGTRALSESHSVTFELVGLDRIHPTFRLELKSILAPKFLVGVDTPSRHANGSVLGKELVTDSTSASRNSAGKRETSRRVEAKGFLDNSKEERNLRKIVPGGFGSVEVNKRLHELLVDSRSAAKIDDDVTKSDRCSVRCSQTRNRSVSVHKRTQGGWCNYMKI